MTDMAVAEQAPIIEQVIIQGDLSKLSPDARIRYYREVCRSLGLNELTRPFEYIVLNGKLTLYARKDCTDQLRGIRGVSITRLERERIDDLYAVTAYAADKNGRQDSAIGAVNVKGLGGENLANALMKAETKAKRRVTLSLCGLGWSDETEVDAVPYARTVVVDHETGEVLDERHTPIKDQAPPEDRDLVRSEDDTAWQSWQRVLAAAEAVGLQPQEVKLGIDRQDLIVYKDQVIADINRLRSEAGRGRR